MKSIDFVMKRRGLRRLASSQGSGCVIPRQDLGQQRVEGGPPSRRVAGPPPPSLCRPRDRSLPSRSESVRVDPSGRSVSLIPFDPSQSFGSIRVALSGSSESLLPVHLSCSFWSIRVASSGRSEALLPVYPSRSESVDPSRSFRSIRVAPSVDPSRSFGSIRDAPSVDPSRSFGSI